QLFYYGNFNRAHTRWSTYSAQPRFGGPYHGLRGQFSILSEAYSYIPYRDRVIVTRQFVREIVQFARDHADEMHDIRQRAIEETVQAGLNPQPDDIVGIRHRSAPFPKLATVLGFEPRADGGNRTGRVIPPDETDTPRDYDVLHFGQFTMTRGVPRPYAYLVPIAEMKVIETLRAHGVRMDRVDAVSGRVEHDIIDEVDRAPTPFQGHRLVRVEATTTVQRIDGDGPYMLIRTGQPLGTLIVYLLEPESEDGLVAWNFFDEHVTPGGGMPVLRIAHPSDVQFGP
ncbi:MAG: hypothetical protein AAF432_10685, partial [Planctomycetota bacterium]